jgi:hypothetical protein
MADVALGGGWPRFAPVTRLADLEDGLAARLADPLWMLARQWQLGEFRGNDGGSPVALRFQGDAHAPTWWRPAGSVPQTSAPWQNWTVGSGPLEVAIEAEPDDGTALLRVRIDAGVAARRALLSAGLPAAAARLHTVAGWDIDATHPDAATYPASPADRAVMACTPDPVALDAAIQPWADPAAAAPQTLLDHMAVTAADATAFATAMRNWQQQWHKAVATVPAGTTDAHPDQRGDPPAWDPERLEYSGSLYFASASDVVLTIDRHPGGPLDWYSADIAPALPADTAGAPAAPPDMIAATPLTRWSVPQPARFSGMPAARFWEFEDARVDFGSIDASPADLARLLLVEYTTVYDHNWYLAPLWVPTGALVHAADNPVTVIDSFGFPTNLESFAEKPAHNTRMFTLSTPSPPAAQAQMDSEWFWFAPRLAAVLDSQAIETVAVRRDEMANIAWAILGNRSDAYGRTLTVPSQIDGAAAAAPAAGGPPRYTVESPLPANWYPLEPVQLNSLGAYLLALRPQEGTPEPPGALLAAGQNWQIHEEELGRAGLTLTRSRTLARWHDGGLYAWTGRSAWAGGGEAVSGLTWDYLQ